jgi:hypothetical protein
MAMTNLGIEYIEAGYLVCAHIAAHAAHRLVAAGTEGSPALAGQNDDLDARFLSTDGHGVDHLADRLRRKGIVLVRPVDRDLGDALMKTEEDLAIFLDRLPRYDAQIDQFLDAAGTGGNAGGHGWLPTCITLKNGAGRIAGPRLMAAPSSIHRAVYTG